MDFLSIRRASPASTLAPVLSPRLNEHALRDTMHACQSHRVRRRAAGDAQHEMRSRGPGQEPEPFKEKSRAARSKLYDLGTQ